MNKEQNISKLRTAAADYRVSPSDKAWLKLESKLRDKKYKHSISQYKIALFAALFVLTLAIVTLVNNTLSINKSATFTEINSFNSENIQPLSESSDALYSIEYISELKMAYNRLGLNSRG